MKCITCSKDIPDASTTCPFCNNKVEPITSASEALGTQDVVPTTPSEYKLPKDQANINKEAVTPPINTTDIMPPPPPSMEEEVQEERVEEEEVDTQANEVGIIAPPPQREELPNIENMDLNANANALSLDLTKDKAVDNLNPNKQVKTKKKLNIKINKKTIILLVIAIVVIGLTVGGVKLYNLLYKSNETRLINAVNKLFVFTNSISSDDFVNGSGSYEIKYSHGNENNNISFNIDGKYGYDIKKQRIDLIANIKSFKKNNEDLLDEELNTELYLNESRVYFLMQNFNDNYIYMDVKDAYSNLKQVEDRFNNPTELFLFKNVNYLFDKGLDKHAGKYSEYISKASSNDVDFSLIIQGISGAVSSALNGLSYTQNIEGKTNVIRINLNNADVIKGIFKEINEYYHTNPVISEEITKIYGDDFYNYFNQLIDSYEFKPIDGDIVIKTDLFSKSLISVTIPSLKDGKVVNTTIVPVGMGFKITSVQDNNTILELEYSTNSSSTSVTTSTLYSLSGFTGSGDDKKDFNLQVTITKDLTPTDVDVNVRNSIDYKYLTETDYQDIANKIRSYGKFGELFNQYYKGIQLPDEQNQDNNQGV